MRPVTVYDIAREANVSVATVSRVLNNTAPVKKETREKIDALIRKHQFQPNALARSLLRKETGTIGFILPDITNPFFRKSWRDLIGKQARWGTRSFCAIRCPRIGKVICNTNASHDTLIC